MKKGLCDQWKDGYIDYPGVGRITDKMVSKYVKDHTHIWDRFNYDKMIRAGLLAQTILMKVVEPPKKKRWFF